MGKAFSDYKVVAVIAATIYHLCMTNKKLDRILTEILDTQQAIIDEQIGSNKGMNFGCVQSITDDHISITTKVYSNPNRYITSEWFKSTGKLTHKLEPLD